MKPVIVIDFDDTLVYWLAAFVAWWNRIHDVAYKVENIRARKGYITDLIDFPRKITVEDVRAFRTSREYANAGCVPGIMAAIPEIAKWADIHIVTAKAEEGEVFVYEWLLRMGLLPFITKIHCVGAAPKLDVSIALRARAFVDDKTTNALSHADAGITIFVPAMPWNHDAVHALVRRFDDWKEVLGEILSILKAV